MVMAVVGHDVWDALCEARLITDLTAAVGVGAARFRMATTNTAHPPAAGIVLGMLLAPHLYEHGLLGAAAATTLAGARHLCRLGRITLTY